MPLRLRRGSDAERQLITPAEGELIYTTDLKEIFVGDGATAGGLKVTDTGISSIGQLNDVDITTIIPTPGQVLKWNGSAFVPDNDIGDVLATSSIGDLGDIDFSSPPSVGQVLKWNGSSFVPSNDSFLNLAQSSIGSLLDVDMSSPPGIGQVLKWNGATFVPANDASISISNYGLGDLNDTDFSTAPTENQILKFDGFNFVPSSTFTGSITNQFGIEFFNIDTGDFYGSFNGTVYGSVKNSNLQTLVDGPTRTHYGTFQGTVVADGLTTELGSTVQSSVVSIYGKINTNIVPDQAGSYDLGDVIQTWRNGYFVNLSVTDTITTDDIILETIYGNDSSVVLDTRAGVLNIASITGDLTGSVFADDSTVLVDAVSGTIPGYISIEQLKAEVAASADFAEFKTRIANL